MVLIEPDAESILPVGLRARKKARTRREISDVATRLFAEQGFEAVTVAHIAAEAQVSVKTVFNYFPSKEDLFFDRAEELFAVLVRTVTERPAGTTTLGALHRLFADNRVPLPGASWRTLRDPAQYEAYRRFVATEDAAPALRARRLVVAADWAERLAPVLAAELGLAAGDSRASALAAMLTGMMTLRERTLAAAMLERARPATVERRVRAVVDESFARLERAFGDLDRPA